MTSSRFRFAFFASTLSNLEIGVMMRLRHPRIVTFLGAGEIVDPPLEGDNVPRVGIFVMLEYAQKVSVPLAQIFSLVVNTVLPLVALL